MPNKKSKKNYKLKWKIQVNRKLVKTNINIQILSKVWTAFGRKSVS